MDQNKDSTIDAELRDRNNKHNTNAILLEV